MRVICGEVHFGFHDSNVESRQTIFSAIKEFDFILELDVNEELIFLWCRQMQIGVAGFVSGVISSKIGLLSFLNLDKNSRELDNSLRLSLIKSDVNFWLVVGVGPVEEVNLDIAVIELLDELNAAISLTEDEETDVVFDCDIDVILIV